MEGHIGIGETERDVFIYMYIFPSPLCYQDLKAMTRNFKEHTSAQILGSQYHPLL